MIEAIGLEKAFANVGGGAPVRAVRDVSLTAADGEITGLLGPNGAGKSSTLRMLATLLVPDRGRATIDGHDTVQSVTEARRRIGYLPHDAGIYPRLTARENIIYFARLCGLSRRDAARRCDHLVDTLDLGSFAERRTAGFSQGQRTRVALARALVHEPGTLLLDEPTSGLDVMATRQLRHVIRGLAEAGHCVLFSSHIMQEVALLADRVAIISDGRVIACDPVAALLARTGTEDLEDAFVALVAPTSPGETGVVSTGDGTPRSTRD